MADTLFGLLKDRGITLRRLDPGHTEHVLCPRCGGGKHREQSLSVKIDDDGNGAVWHCFRGTCGWIDNVQTGKPRDDRKPHQQPKREPMPQHTVWQTTERPEWLYAFFAERKIGAVTVDRFGVYWMDRHFPGLGERPAIVFPFVWRGEVRSRKYRPHPEKSPQSQDVTDVPTLFNADVLDGAETVYFVEGEPDVMAMSECQFTATVSLRDGAPAEAKFRDDDRRFAALATHANELAKVKRFVLAGDMDAPGLALREELARRLGRHRCSLVTWPEGCKDACDVLRGENGYHDLHEAIEAAEPYPIEGLKRVTPGLLGRFAAMPAPTTMGSGTIATTRAIKLPTEGRLIVVTGYANHGKSTWTRFVAVRTAIEHDRRWLVFSPEHQPWEHFFIECAEAYSGKPFWPGPNPSMTQGEVETAETFIQSHITMLVCDSEKPTTLDWLLDSAIMAVLRDGITDFLIDPWNEIEHNRGDLTETEYTSRVLQRLRAFALRYGCNVWLVAHPAKPPQLRGEEKRKPPLGYEISGSSHWANKPDLGITVWQPDGPTDVILWKSRFKRWGTKAAIVRLEFDPTCGRYRDPMIDPGPAAPNWTDI